VRRKRSLILVLALAMLMVVALPAEAVQFGGPDTDPVMYNGVGIEMSYPGTGNYVYLCTVTLIDPYTVLTAGHCTYGYDGPGAWTVVGFEQSYPYLFSDPDSNPVGLRYTGISGTPIPHPDYAGFAGFPATYDVGVIKLSTPVTDINPWPLAGVGTLDSLNTKRGLQNTTFDITGYGVQDALPPSFQDDFDRYRGHVKLNNLISANNGGWNVQYSNSPAAKHSGGTCFGDSGGPVLYNGEIVAVNSFVQNNQCMGNGFGFRVDIQEIQTWIATVSG
jgi:hypothetical protein